MKRILFFGMLSSFMMVSSYAVKHVITNAGTTFTPANITINLGDTVVFSLGSIHNAVEVSHETYLANGATSNGGFSVPLGGGTVVPGSAKIYYYVCQPHASMGMKGIINVAVATGINSYNSNAAEFKIYPNPAADQVTVSYSLKRQSPVNIEIINIAGARVAVLQTEQQVAGLHEQSFDLNGFYSPGIYFILLKTDDSVTTNKIIIK